MSGEEQRQWRAWRNRGLNGNLVLPFIFHFQPRVKVFWSLIFFFRIGVTFFFPINFLIWGTATVSGGEIGRFLFSPKKFGILKNVMLCLFVH